MSEEARTFVWALAAVAICLTACQRGAVQPARGAHVEADFEPVDKPPPPAKPERVGAKPDEESFWLPGEWHWVASSWRWREGSWTTRPEGAKLVPWALERDADGQWWHAPSLWVFDNGWRVPVHVGRRSGARTRSCEPPAPPAPSFDRLEPSPP